MNVDNILNIEKRTGISNSDIDDFVSKASAVEEAVKALREGKVAPEDVKVEGIETEEEKKEKELKRLKRREELKREEEALRLKRKQEEKERWWAGAEMYAARKDDEENADDETDEGTVHSRSMARYSADYSRWEQWTPNDPATLQERQEEEAAADEARNKEFENSNPEFCKQFLEDMEARKKASEKKLQSANALKLKGNKYFKAKKYTEALTHYMDALKQAPYDGVAVLTNIAQANIKLQNYEDAVEFLNRALYLQPDNVKALSRKAFVLGELVGGEENIQEALRCAERAHKVDPSCGEVEAQFKDLTIALGDIKSEKEVRALADAPERKKVADIHNTLIQGEGDDKAMAGALQQLAEVATLSSTGAAPGLAVIDTLQLLLQRDDQNEKVNEGLDKAVLDSAMDVLREDRAARVYLRTSGTLAVLVEKIKSLLTLNDTTGEEAKSHLSLGSLLQMLATAVSGERPSKIVVMDDPVVLSSVKSLLGMESTPVDTLYGCISLIASGIEDTFLKMRSLLLKDKSLLLNLGAAYCHLNDILTSRRSVHSKTPEAVKACCAVIRDLCFSQEGKQQMSSVSSPIVSILGSSLISHVKKPMAQSTELLEITLETLLGCSQSEVLRGAFADHLVTTGDSELTTVHAILRLTIKHKWSIPNGLAVLMNVTIQDAPEMRRLVYDAGGMDVVMNVLQAHDGADVSEYSRVRAAGLLSRMTGIDEVQGVLRSASTYRMLCNRLCKNCELTGDKVEKWVIDERAQLVRVLASVTNPPKECIREGANAGIVRSLLSCLPMPRKELHQVTPTSVILPPSETIQPVLLGNIARCLMPYADDTEQAVELYTNQKNYGVEKLICMMATCTDMRVRKNIAILLAKGCRNPSTRQRVEHLRGLQMLVELQKQL